MSRQCSWQWHTIHWPRPLSWSMVLVLVQRLVADPHLGSLVIETRATPHRLHFRIAADQQRSAAVAALVADLIPGATLTPSREVFHPLTAAARLKVSHPSLSLDTTRVEALTRAVLAGLSGLGKGEQVVVQCLIGGRIPPSVNAHTAPDAGQGWWSLLNIGSRAPGREAAGRIRERTSQHGALVSIRLGAHAPNQKRARLLIEQVFGALRVIEAAGVRLHLAAESPDALMRARIPWRYPLRLSVSEIACLLAWPIGEGDLPGLPPVSPRLLSPPLWLTRTKQAMAGRIFATSTAPGEPVALGIPPGDALTHTILLGPTGSGKSTAMLHLILADIAAGRSVIVLDPMANLVTEILERIPPSRRDDVVVIDPTDAAPVGLNPLAAQQRSPELVVDSILSTFKALFADSWGVRTEEILTAALLTLAKAGGQAATLVALPSLLTNPTFRVRITRRVHDPLGVSAFWAKYEAKSPEQQAVEIAPVLNKLQQFVIRPHMRAVLGQVEPRFNLRDVFTHRRIVLVSLNKGLLGPESARLLGSLLIGQLWPLILERAALPPQRRHMVSIYVDEVHDFIRGIPGDLSDALAQSRALGVAWHMAHQYRAQLTPQMRQAIDANARNKICFGLSAPDARDMATMSPTLEALDFIRLPRFATYSTTWVAGKESGWISGMTAPPPPPQHDAADLKAHSAGRYGTSAATVEAGLHELIGLGSPATPTPTPEGEPPPVFGRATHPRRPAASPQAGDQSPDPPQH